MLQEVTVWNTPYTVNNGIYHVNGAGHLVGYQPAGGELRLYQKSPIKSFSKSGRKFIKVGEYPEEMPSDAIQVKGSNGNVYTIIDGKCSCPGFTFRGRCKHVESL